MWTSSRAEPVSTERGSGPLGASRCGEMTSRRPRSGALFLAVLLVTVAAAPAGGREPAALLVSHTVPVAHVSQLAEPAPIWWRAGATPYCAAAASLSVMASFGVAFPSSPLRTTFDIGRQGNTTTDPGLDPNGISYLMRSYGGEGRIHALADRGTALHELVGRLNASVPVVALTQAGNHTVTVFGYEAIAGGSVTGLYVADPLSGFMGRVGIESWQWDHLWMGSAFAAAGPDWQGRFVFVSYREWRSAAPVASASATASRPVSVAPTLASRWLAQSPYPTLARGEVAMVTVSFRNTGTLAWVKGTPTEARLGIVEDSTLLAELGFASTWVLPSRPAVQYQRNVAPNEIATFNFNVRAGQQGVWVMRLRPVVDGVAWLDDEGVYVTVTVK